MDAFETAFESTNEFREEDSIEKWIELEESGEPYWKYGNIAKKVRNLLEENKMLKEELGKTVEKYNELKKRYNSVIYNNCM